MQIGPLFFPPHQTRITQGWLQTDVAGNGKTYWLQTGEDGVNDRKLLLLWVNVFTSLVCSCAFVEFSFSIGFDPVEF